MGIDHPDGTLRTTEVTVSGPVLIGTNRLDEVAARISAVHTYNRLGNLVWWHGFETTSLHWTTESSDGADSAATISTTTARNGDKSMRLRAGPGLADYVEVRRRLPYVVLGNVGFEWHVAFGQADGILQVAITILDGAEFHQASVQWNIGGEYLGYMSSAGSYTTLSTAIAHYDDINLFHALKLFVDFTDDVYIKLLMDERTYDLSGIAIRSGEAVQAPRTELLVRYTTGAAEDQDAYIDDVIVTQNE